MGLKMVLILGDHVVADGTLRLLAGQGLAGKRLLADIMIAGHQIERAFEPLVDRVKAPRRILVGRRAGLGMGDIAEMNDEVGAQAIELGHLIGRARLAQFDGVDVKTADRRGFGFGDMGIRNNGEGKEVFASNHESKFPVWRGSDCRGLVEPP